MRRLVHPFILLALGFAGPCLAAARPAPANLRPSQPAPSARPAAAPAQSKVAPLAGQLAPPLPFAGAPGLASPGLGGLGLQALRLGTADPGPACRSTCASARYVAGSTDEGATDNWRQCVLTCGTSRP